MKSEEKTRVINLISNGDIQKAVDILLTVKRNKSLDKEALAIASRYNRLKRKERSGILSPEQVNVRENQIIAHLIDAVNHSETEPYPPEKSIYTSNATRPVIWKYIITIVTIGILLGLAEAFHLIDIIPDKDPMQLTVFVKDKQDNVVLEMEGELNISMGHGHRSFNKAIGEDGRTNFGDIPRKYKGDTIRVGLKAEGWEVDGRNAFLFTKKSIDLIVKRDNSLGIVRGRVTNHNGQEFLEGAKVVIKDTAVFTDVNGFFEIILPEEIRVKKVTEPYDLNISKAGYKTVKKPYYPRSSDAEIRLDPAENK